MNRLIICGSPRISGRCGALSNTLFEACIAEFLDDEVSLVPVSEISISGCVGCEGCNALVPGVEDGPDELVRCVLEDDMVDVYDQIDAADELIVVSPVYFSGPPSQFKALLDRLQPYYQETAEARAAARERGDHFFTGVKPATLHIVGDGGNPQGYDALVSIVQASLAVAGFRLESIVDWVGKLSPEGDILEPAEVFTLVGDEEEEAADSADSAPQEVEERPQLHFNDEQVESVNDPQKAKRPAKSGNRSNKQKSNKPAAKRSNGKASNRKSGGKNRG